MNKYKLIDQKNNEEFNLKEGFVRFGGSLLSKSKASYYLKQALFKGFDKFREIKVIKIK